MSSYKKLSNFGDKRSEKSDNVPQILRKEDKDYLIQNNKVVVVDVYADWCGPCKIVSPLFAALFPKYNIPSICALAKENVDLKLSPSVQVVPTFQFFVYGNLDSVISGADIALVENKIIELVNAIQSAPQQHQQPPPPQVNPHEQIPPQLTPQFQYQQPSHHKPSPSPGVGGMITSAPPSMPMPVPVSESTPPNPSNVAQTQNEGFQHAQQSRNQFYEQPAHLPMSLPIRRKA